MIQQRFGYTYGTFRVGREKMLRIRSFSEYMPVQQYNTVNRGAKCLGFIQINRKFCKGKKRNRETEKEDEKGRRKSGDRKRKSSVFVNKKKKIALEVYRNITYFTNMPS